MSSTLSISCTDITTKQIQACLTLYPKVLERVYKATRPKAKLAEIIEDDRWRYEELPREVAKDGGRALTKEELQRLVKWKITHGTNRPFLPSMVAKNNLEEITTATTDLSSLLSIFTQPTYNITLIFPTLDQICALKGVGPATGSLVLSVYSPKWIPFFEDELYDWIDGGGKTKLKYDRKEYAVVLKGVAEMLERIGGEVTARNIEKVGYIMGHVDVLDGEDKKSILNGVGVEKIDSSRETKDEKNGSEDNDNAEDEAAKDGKHASKAVAKRVPAQESTVGKAKNAKRAPKRDASNAPSDNPGTRRSKRLKK